MEWNKQQVKNLLLVVCGGIAFYTLLHRLGAVAAGIRWVLDVLAPFLLGGTLAFVLNVPMRAIENNMRAEGRRFAALRRPLALVLTLLAVMGVIGLACMVIVPGIREAVLSIADQLPGAVTRLEDWSARLQAFLPQIEALIVDLNIDWEAISRKLMTMVQNWGTDLLSSGGNIIGSLVNGITTFVIGIVFAVYLLLQKEKLARQGRQVCYALLPAGMADRVLEVLRLANRTFSGFLSGQCLEAVILGTMFVIAMTVFRLPYALLVGVFIALTALIPIVGAFIGCGVGALLIAVTDPWKALLFIVLFLILQQIEGNFIYPYVVGNSVGLPSIWVLAAFTLGGKLMGLVGMLIFIPLCSVLYALFREFVKGRLAEKNIPEHKWRDPPGKS